jgi:tetratricopeptide (TPR) repeat protein
MKEHRKLAAIMFTDIVGYSALMSKDEKLALSILEKNRSFHKSAILKFNGQYIKEIGDGTLAIFQSSLDAVGCAIKIMKLCRKENSFSLRIGIHIGDIIFRDGDVFGDGVNIASRIEAGGNPGGIYISERVYEDIKNKHEIISIFVEERTLKNIDIPVKIYSIDVERSSILKSSVQKPDQEKNQQLKKAIPISKKLVIIGGGIIILIILSLFVLYLLPKQREDVLPERIVVAVFENRTSDPKLDELGKMACDWITQGLSQTCETDVVPSTTVMQISGMLLDQSGGKKQSDYLEQLAQQALSSIVVSGSYYLQNNELQFRAEVKNIKEENLIYSMPVISGSINNPMQLIEKVAGDIAGGLAYHFKIQDIHVISKPPNQQAYREYLTGLEYFGQDYEKAMHHFILSAKSDSLFVMPRFFIASAFMNRGDYSKADSIFQAINDERVRLSPFERHMLNFHRAFLVGNNIECLRSLQLAELISPADQILNYLIGLVANRLNKPALTVETYAKHNYAYLHHNNYILGAWRLSVLATAFHLLGEYDKELIEAMKGQQYYPDRLWFYAVETHVYAVSGKTGEIDKVIEKCRSVTAKENSEGEVIMQAALELSAHGYPQEAKKYFPMVVEWYRNHPEGEDALEYLGDALYHAGNYEEAQQIFQKLTAEFPDKPEFIGYLGVIAARMGDKGNADKYAEELRHLNGRYLFGRHTFWRARIAALLNEPGKAVNLLNESFAQGNRFGIYIHQTIDFAPLHSYEPYMELLKPKE